MSRAVPLLALVLTACDPGPATSDSFGITPLTTADGKVLHLALFTAPQPPERGANLGRLVLTDANGQSVEGVSLSVTPWMPEHGHGTSVAPTVQADGQGGFSVSDLYLAMAGTWQLRVEVSGTVTDELVPSFDIP